MDRKKELKEWYKNMKPDMGIYIINNNFNRKCYIEVSQDIKGTINSTKFKLDFGNHPNRELQKEWKEKGESNFKIEILEILKYDKDESKTDYSEEMDILKIVWEERLLQKGMEFYKRSLK